MSIIYGYISLSEKPVDREFLGTMKEAMMFSRPDEAFDYTESSAVLCALHKYSTPESVNEKYPMLDESGNIVFMAACRIDNRDELYTLLQIPHTQRTSITDGELMFQSYLKWGEGACDRLLGDWAFLAWHKIEKRLIVARDHCGITAMYYTLLPGLFVFSSSPKGILALDCVPKKINELRIAQILTVTPGNGEDTAYEGIFNLVPGHYLNIENGKLNKIKYWELTEQDDLILPKEQDYYDQFIELFTQSVRARLRTNKNVGISLSGGLDSTSIAAIAAIELAKQNKELYAFTSVPLYKDYSVPKHRNGDEGELAGLMAKKYPNIRHYLVNAEGYDPIEAIKKGVEILDEPMHAAANQYWIQAINEMAVKMNVGNLLNGQGGNGVISWPTKKAGVIGSKNIHFYTYYLKIKSIRLKDYFFNRAYYKYPFLKYSDISTETIEKFELFIKMKNIGYDASLKKRLTFKQMQVSLITNNSNNSCSSHFRKSLFYGLNILDPNSDKKLIEFCCQIPKSIYAKSNYEKVLIKNGLKNYLPIEILTSNKKGLQSIDILLRLNTEQKIDSYKNNDNAIIDPSINYIGKYRRNLSVKYFLNSLS